MYGPAASLSHNSYKGSGLCTACRPPPCHFCVYTLEIGSEAEHLGGTFQHDDGVRPFAQLQHMGAFLNENIIDCIISFRAVKPDEANVFLKINLYCLIFHHTHLYLR